MCQKIAIWTVFILFFITQVSANNYCYSSGGVFGIIIASVFVTIIIISVAVVVIWYLWTNNRLTLEFINILNKNKKKVVNSKLDVESVGHDVGHDYAFDNPYFKEDDNVDHQRNGLPNNDSFVQSAALPSSLCKQKQKQGQHKSMDDSFMTMKSERLEVELTGHDFTGLGFNICGNMREGIFIKDVQSRGPANECGKVKAGYRVVSVSVSFERMVYEDAIAILSYASPYNVCLHLEKPVDYSTIQKIFNNDANNKNTLSSFSSLKSRKISHPLYKSHSVENLTQIAKDSSLSEKSTSSAGKNVVSKLKSQIFNRKDNIKSNDNSLQQSTDENVNKVIKTKESDRLSKHIELSVPIVQVINEKNNDIDVITVEKQSQEYASDDTNQILTNTPIIADKNTNIKDTDVNQSETEINDNHLKEECNQSVCKAITPAKRKGKAPQPPVTSPPTQSDYETIETTAQVHIQDDNNDQSKDTPLESITELESEATLVNENISISSESISSEEKSKLSEQVISVPTHSHLQSQTQSQSPQSVQNTAIKPKSSSLSDLTYKRTDNLQSVLFERAVSLDLNAQNLPEHNLHQHPKNLLINVLPSDQNLVSAPMMSRFNQQISSETTSDSSDNTLNELNFKNVNYDSFIAETDVSNNVGELQMRDSKQTLFDTFPQNTSTPVKECNRAIDQYLELDLSPSQLDNEQTILIEKSQTNAHKLPHPSDQSNKVIEISRTELDDIMMSHKAFLSKQAMRSLSSPIVSPINVKDNDYATDPIDFESWSYISGDFNTINNMTVDAKESTLYTTALDMNSNNTSNQEICNEPKKLPEISGITLKTGENGQIAATYIITTNESSDSSFTSTSSSSPSN